MPSFVRVFIFCLSCVWLSCASYKQNIMFKTDELSAAEKIKAEAAGTQRNFTIQKNDRLSLAVFSNKGERLIDPNPELTQTNPTATNTASPVFTVDASGTAQLPLVGPFHFEGLTLRQAEAALQKAYADFFKEPFVQLAYLNKRVVVLGALGGQVIPLENENTRLLEVLALAKGLTNDSKAQNIRLIRGDHVYEIDMSTISGFREGNVIVDPGDVIYVEPVRRPVSESLRDYYGLVSMVVGLATLITLISNLQ
jgi:polysaccharide export outer membrane protein